MGTALPLAVTGRVLLEEISMEVSRLNREAHPQLCGQTPANPQGAQTEEKGRGNSESKA